MAESRTILTGGAGFIGSHLAQRLLAAGQHVTVIDDFSTGRRENLAPLLESHGERLRLLEGRAADLITDPHVMAHVTRVFHLAAAVGVKLVVDDPGAMIRNNIDETDAVLRAAADAGAAVLITSSSEVYGKCPVLPLREDMELVYGPTTASRWAYGLTKALDEHLALDLARRRGLKSVVVRLFNTIGPRQIGRYGMVVPRFIDHALHGRDLTIYGDGQQTRAFCDVRDVVRALAELIDQPDAHGRVFNVGSTHPITIEQLADQVIQTVGRSDPDAPAIGKAFVAYETVYGEGFEDPSHRLPDMTQLRDVIGFAPADPAEPDPGRAGRPGPRRRPRAFDPRTCGMMIGFASIPLPTTAPRGLAQSSELGTLLGPYMGVFFVAFFVAIAVTPLMRKLAVANGIVDWPDLKRKNHALPVAYLGGVAIFVGWLAGVCSSYLIAPGTGAGLAAYVTDTLGDPSVPFQSFPLSIFLGAAIITYTGLHDDVYGMRARVKVGGQLFAAAVLTWDQIGIDFTSSVLNLVYLSPPDSVVYFLATFLVAAFVLGGCNAVNLIDGLDGLAAGVIAIAMVGFLLIALLMGDEPLIAVDNCKRIVLCLATLGAILGFLPYNFNPATIFMGDAGSLLLGFLSVTAILLFGDAGGWSLKLVTAALIVFAVPITDTSLAIVRRKLRGQPIMAPDNQHLHHLLRRAGLSVRQSVLVMYAAALIFGAVGVAMIGFELQWRYSLAIFCVVYGFIMVTAFKYGAHCLAIEQLHAHQHTTIPPAHPPAAPSPDPASPVSDPRLHRDDGNAPPPPLPATLPRDAAQRN